MLLMFNSSLLMFNSSLLIFPIYSSFDTYTSILKRPGEPKAMFPSGISSKNAVRSGDLKVLFKKIFIYIRQNFDDLFCHLLLNFNFHM